MEARVKRYFVMAIAMSFAAPACAGGSIGLDEVVSRLAGQSAKLMEEINDSLVASNTKISDQVCTGLRLGRHWVHLGATRIPPFSCEIGGKVLAIEGTVSFYDDTGKDTGADPVTSRYYAMTDVSWDWN